VILAILTRIAGAQPEPPPSDAPGAVSAPGESAPVPLPPGPCGAPPAAGTPDFTIVCSTTRVAPSSTGALYAQFMDLRNRGGFTIGVRALTTLSTDMRRESVELHLGTVKDRGLAYRLLGRATRADLHDGGIDAGFDLGLQLVRMSRRWHLGVEGSGVFLIKFGEDNYSLGGALFGEYEVVANDRFALVASARAGLDFFTFMDRSGDETRFSPYLGLALGGSVFSKGP